MSEYDSKVTEIEESMKRLQVELEPTETLEKKVAEDFFNMKCGPLHLSWAIDRYWAKVAKEVFIPNLLAIYEALVKKGATEKDKMYWGDADGDLYFIPNENRKVIVFTTQNTNYLFILEPHKTSDYFPEAEKLKDKFGEEYETHSLHIRKFWRPYNKEYLHPSEEEMLKDINIVIDSVENLEKFADDFSKYPQRPSLEMYRKIKFNLDEYHSKPCFYGDCRDSGYIISLSRMNLNGHDIRSKHSFDQLEILATCYLSCMTSDLEIEAIDLKGYS